MVKSLQKHGNSHALVIDKSLMEALGIGPDTPLKLTICGHSLVVTPLDVGVGSERIEAAIRKLRPRYRRMLRNLAG